MFLDKIPVRIRLSLGHALWMVFIFIAIGMGVYGVVEDNINQSLDATLLTSARTIMQAHEVEKYGLQSDRSHYSRYWKSFLDDFLGEERISIRAYAQLVDVSGLVQAKTSNSKVRLPVTPAAVARAEKGLETFEDFRLQNGTVLRQLTMPVIREDRFTGELVQVGASLSSTQQTLDSVKRMLWLTLSTGLMVSVIFGYVLTRWSFQPVTKITKSVASLGVYDSFTERLKLPEANDELKKLVITFNEMLGRIEDAFLRLRRFTGDVSHELRTPLAVLRGEAELALRRERNADDYKSALRSIAKESLQMSTIVEDLLLLARAQGKSIALKFEQVDTRAFLDAIMDSVKPVFDEKSIELDIHNHAHSELYMAPNYLSIALKNILLNAAKHSNKDSKVEFTVSSTFAETKFVVKDFGEGIPEDSLPYIFDAFYRADTVRNRDKGGYGIGLSLAKALVELQNGRIFAESKRDEGACLTIVLPHKM